jgi:tetratricopeptide (TPR) repeat protein
MTRCSTAVGLASLLLPLVAGCQGTAGTIHSGSGLLSSARLWKSDPPALLIGPEAAAQAPPPPELPAAEAARLAFRTAQEFEKNGRIPEAIQFYEKARSHDPALRLQAARRLAVLYDLTGDFPKADAEYALLLQTYPKDADLLNDLGYSHYCRGQWSTSEHYLTQAVQLQPQHKKAWINLGLARAQQGKVEESLHAFQQAVSPAQAHCNLAFVLAAQGQREQALQHYRTALQLDPSLRLAQAALARLSPPSAEGPASTP